VIKTPHRKNVCCYEMFTDKVSNLDWYFGTTLATKESTRTNYKRPTFNTDLVFELSHMISAIFREFSCARLY